MVISFIVSRAGDLLDWEYTNPIHVIKFVKREDNLLGELEEAMKKKQFARI